MDIVMGSLLRGAQETKGTAVIVDVFRAFTTAAIAFSRGAYKVILVAEVDEALDLRRRGLGDLCMGEVAGIRPEGFDFGNSPFELSQADVRGKTLIQSTRAGTVGVAAAPQRRSDLRWVSGHRRGHRQGRIERFARHCEHRGHGR